MTGIPQGTPAHHESERRLYATLLDYFGQVLFSTDLGQQTKREPQIGGLAFGLSRSYSSIAPGYCAIEIYQPAPEADALLEFPDRIRVEATYVRPSMQHQRTGEFFQAGLDISLTVTPADPRRNWLPTKGAPVLLGPGFSSLSATFWYESEPADPLLWQPWDADATGRRRADRSGLRVSGGARHSRRGCPHVFRPLNNPDIYQYTTPRYLPVDLDACLTKPSLMFLGPESESIPSRAIFHRSTNPTRQHALPARGASIAPETGRSPGPPAPRACRGQSPKVQRRGSTGRSRRTVRRGPMSAAAAFDGTMRP